MPLNECDIVCRAAKHSLCPAAKSAQRIHLPACELRLKYLHNKRQRLGHGQAISLASSEMVTRPCRECALCAFCHCAPRRFPKTNGQPRVIIYHWPAAGHERELCCVHFNNGQRRKTKTVLPARQCHSCSRRRQLPSRILHSICWRAQRKCRTIKLIFAAIFSL